MDNSKPYVAVNYHYWGMSEEVKIKATERFAKICNYISTTYDLQLLLLPMAPSDDEPLMALSEKLTGNHGVLEYAYDFRIARGVISGAQWVFTMKHHPIIFAQGENVPVIAVCLDDYYYRKNKGALANFGHEDLCLDKDAFYSEAALRKIDQTVSGLDQIKEGMAEQLVVYEKENDQMLDGVV